MKCNAVLRSRGGNTFLHEVFEKLCKGNMYVTSLHVINSSVVKLGKLTKAGKVLR